MSAAGIIEDRITLTSLLAIFGDSPLAEELVAGVDEVMLRPPARGAGQDLASDAPMPDLAYATAQGKPRLAWQRQPAVSGGNGGGHGGGNGALVGASSSPGEATGAGGGAGGGAGAPGSDGPPGFFFSDEVFRLQQTDLRGLTRPAATIALRGTLRRAAEASARGESVGGAWEIITRTPRSARRPPTGAGDETLDALTISFLRASGVRYQRRARGVLVGADELEQAAATANVAARTQAVLQGSLLRIGIAVTTVAAVGLIPRLATML
eukprot:scaffold4560_cov95-Isochrysis_galbana.AAC.2